MSSSNSNSRSMAARVASTPSARSPGGGSRVSHRSRISSIRSSSSGWRSSFRSRSLELAAELVEASAAGRTDAADRHLELARDPRVVGPRLHRHDAQQSLAALGQLTERLPEPDCSSLRTTSDSGDGWFGIRHSSASSSTGVDRVACLLTRQASRRAVVHSQRATAWVSPTVAALRTRASHAVCTTSSDCSLSRPVARTTCHRIGLITCTRSSSAAGSPARQRANADPAASQTDAGSSTVCGMVITPTKSMTHGF